MTLANMLGDSTPSNIAELVSQILAVVRLPEEMITVALHDNDYDVEKSLEALLDSSNNTHVRDCTLKYTPGTLCCSIVLYVMASGVVNYSTQNIVQVFVVEKGNPPFLR